MNSYAKNEFYGDLLVYKIEKWRKLGSSWLFYILAIIFLIVFAGLIFQPEKTSELLNGLTVYGETVDQEGNPYRWLAIVGLIIILMPFMPTALHIARKYWLYPKKSLTQRAYCAVQSKELISHPRTRNSSVNSRSYYVIICHPADPRQIPVDISEVWYQTLKPGDQIHVNYHPAERNIVYLRKEA
ncbi:MAG: hypothetical protein ABIN80_16535 [Dyadobacter sp.]|uniref:hypothetical protein n=1 Tax=Dyadobacter sp. TaxID=1914288 RepID=UPI003265897C